LVVSGRVPRFILLAFLIALASPVFEPAAAQKLPTLGPREGWRVGDLAYDFTVKDLEGRDHRLKDRRGQSVVHLVFWATWCMPCVEEVPHLKLIYDRYRARGFEIFGVVVAMNQTKEGVRTFVEKNGMVYPILWDGDLKVMNRYRVDSIPQNFLIDRDGIIRYAGTGLPAGYEELVMKMLAAQATPRAALR
jgi:peroxiredoxin